MKGEKKINKAKIFNLHCFPMDFARICCSPLLFFFRIKKLYVTPVAKKKIRGGAIIASNHTRFLDPLMLCAAFWYRRMFYLTANTVMSNKTIKFLLKKLGCIEINREICDINSIRQTVTLLKSGQVISIFPQGGISRDDNMDSIKSGIVLMAMQAKVPIIPVYMHHKVKPKNQNCIVIGEPIPAFGSEDLPLIKDINSYADYVLKKMTECKTIFESSRRDQ